VTAVIVALEYYKALQCSCLYSECHSKTTAGKEV